MITLDEVGMLVLEYDWDGRKSLLEFTKLILEAAPKYAVADPNQATTKQLAQQKRELDVRTASAALRSLLLAYEPGEEPHDEVRRLIQEILVPWRELRGAQTRTDDEAPIPNVFEDGHSAAILTDLGMLGLLRAFNNAGTKKSWDDHNGQRVPTHRMPTNKGKGSVFVSVRPENGDETPPETALPELWAKVQAMDDLTSDTLLVCMAHWVARSDGPKTPVWVTADAVLDARGIERIKKSSEPGNWQHGHRTEDRLAVGRAFAQLDSCWLKLANVRATLPGRKRAQTINIESKALAMLDKAGQGQLDGEDVFLGARVMPGQWAEAYWDLGVRQTGLLAQKILAYDPYRRRAEKRLGKYLAFHYRINAKRKPDQLRLKVKTLLENAGIEPNRERPTRTRNDLEDALNTLRSDGLIDNWGMVIEDADEKLPPRGWLPVWLEWTIWIQLPAFAVEQNERIPAPPKRRQRRLPAGE